MVANFDLVSVLVHVASDDSVIGLLALGNNVERVTDLHAHVFILWCVVDSIFANELLITFVVFLVQTNRACGQWHAQFVLLRISKLNVNANLFFYGLARIVIAGEVITLAIQHEFFFHIKARGLEQRHLLRLVIANGCQALSRVEVIFKKTLFFKF